MDFPTAKPLSFYDTFTRKKIPFVPLDKSNIRLYVCGPTVYDYAHIGNARPVVVFDVLYRLLKYRFPTVTYVRNITDVDDKINERAKKSGRSIKEITEETTKTFHSDMNALEALTPDIEPRATEHISQMIENSVKVVTVMEDPSWIGHDILMSPMHLIYESGIMGLKPYLSQTLPELLRGYVPKQRVPIMKRIKKFNLNLKLIKVRMV